MKINKNYFIALAIFVIVMLLVGLFSGCTPTPNGSNILQAESTSHHVVFGGYDVRVYETTYKGHDYILFNSDYRLDVVHDPDCKKCKQNSYE